MQIVIKIDEKDKQEIDRCLKGKGLAFLDNAQLIKRVVLAVFHGTPLPKGHGDLIDVDSLDIPVNVHDGFEAMAYIEGVDPIIEADRSEVEE